MMARSRMRKRHPPSGATTRNCLHQWPHGAGMRSGSRPGVMLPSSRGPRRQSGGIGRDGRARSGIPATRSGRPLWPLGDPERVAGLTMSSRAARAAISAGLRTPPPEATTRCPSRASAIVMAVSSTSVASRSGPPTSGTRASAERQIAEVEVFLAGRLRRVEPVVRVGQQHVRADPGEPCRPARAHRPYRSACPETSVRPGRAARCRVRCRRRAGPAQGDVGDAADVQPRAAMLGRPRSQS